MNSHARRCACFLITVCLLILAACDNDARARIDSGQNMRAIGQAIAVYASEHEDNRYPQSLDDLKPQLGEQWESVMTNPLTGGNPGYELATPGERELVDPRKVLIYQLRGGKRDTTLPVLYADLTVRPYEAGAE